jgi:hypothetical protein
MDNRLCMMVSRSFMVSLANERLTTRSRTPLTRDPRPQSCDGTPKPPLPSLSSSSLQSRSGTPADSASEEGKILEDRDGVVCPRAYGGINGGFIFVGLVFWVNPIWSDVALEAEFVRDRRRLAELTL